MSATRIIMRASLHRRAPNTYYGQWLCVFAKDKGSNRGSIAHNRLAARAEFAAFDAPARDFQEIARRPAGNLRFDQK
jgi:hypothetical protein